MSKNIYNTDIIPSQNSFTVNDLTVNQSITLSGAPPNELLITNSNSQITTFANGPSGYLLEIGQTSGQPRWTNSAIINSVTTNTLTIPGTTTGDLLVASDTTGDFSRLPIGTEGQILTVGDDGLAQWQALVLPNPLTISNLIVNTNLKLYGGGGPLFMDGNSNVYSEANQYYNDNSLQTYTNTFTVLSTYTSWNTIAGHKYKLCLNFECGNAYPDTYSILTFNWNSNAVKQNYSLGPLDCIQFEYIFLETVTGNKTSSLVGGTSNNTNTSNCTKFAWSLLSLGV